MSIHYIVAVALIVVFISLTVIIRMIIHSYTYLSSRSSKNVFTYMSINKKTMELLQAKQYELSKRLDDIEKHLNAITNIIREDSTAIGGNSDRITLLSRLIGGVKNG